MPKKTKKKDSKLVIFQAWISTYNDLIEAITRSSFLISVLCWVTRGKICF